VRVLGRPFKREFDMCVTGHCHFESAGEVHLPDARGHHESGLPYPVPRFNLPWAEVVEFEVHEDGVLDFAFFKN